MSRHVRLQVNIDHVATLRNARGTSYPDPIEAALLCEKAGCTGITAHLREDRRHIRDEDVRRLRQRVTTLLNLEMAATESMVALAEEIQPNVVTFVPERREERTTEGGLAIAQQKTELTAYVARLRARGVVSSMFIAASIDDIEASKLVGAEIVELHTGEYAHASTPDAIAREVARLKKGAVYAKNLDLRIAAGHGLTQANLVPLLRAIPEIEEVNIGHALVADALWLGIESATKAYLMACTRAPTGNLRSLL